MTFRRRLRRGAGVAAPTMTLAVTAGTYEGDSTSAVSGIAPLYVFVDCSASTSTQTTKPFRECQYVHDYGDTGGGNWGYGAFAGTAYASRNVGLGAVGGHVYRTPGVYTLRVTGYDGSVAVIKSITVTVRPANGATDGGLGEFNGGRTLLVSTSGDFDCAGLTGTPATLTSSDWPTIIQAANVICDTASVSGNTFGVGKVRILLRA
jgi:hypothetical protein